MDKLNLARSVHCRSQALSVDKRFYNNRLFVELISQMWVSENDFVLDGREQGFGSFLPTVFAFADKLRAKLVSHVSNCTLKLPRATLTIMLSPSSRTTAYDERRYCLVSSIAQTFAQVSIRTSTEFILVALSPWTRIWSRRASISSSLRLFSSLESRRNSASLS